MWAELHRVMCLSTSKRIAFMRREIPLKEQCLNCQAHFALQFSVGWPCERTQPQRSKVVLLEFQIQPWIAEHNFTSELLMRRREKRTGIIFKDDSKKKKNYPEPGKMVKGEKIQLHIASITGMFQRCLWKFEID